MAIVPITVSPEWIKMNLLHLLSRSDEEILSNLDLPQRTTKAERVAAIRQSRKKVAEVAVNMIWPDEN